ncbi:MAG: amidohydrolase family protein [Candidatus Aminicenantes bacterium]|nr:amidohydrolase family protein [Candidatus Aminicenantes bacterium]
MADLVVLTQNIFDILPEEIRNTRVRMTIVSGKIVFRK